MPEHLFVFVQLEFPWRLGPADGRYLTRSEPDGEPERVLVIGTLEAPAGPAGSRAGAGGRGLLARLGAGAAGVEPEPEPGPVTRTRVTVIDPISLSAESQARAWLTDLDTERELAAASEVVNHVLHLHRIAAADPHVNEVSPTRALVVRAGWGEGEQVAHGRWRHARELAAAPEGRGIRRLGGRARSSALRPQERLAALLGARARALVCEELALRARLDLDRGRLRHCAHELDAALLSAVGELRAEGRQDLALRVAELEQLEPGIAEQARLALASASADVPGPDQSALAHALQRLESALRARAASSG